MGQLLLSLALVGSPGPPPEWACRLLDALPDRAKVAVWDAACDSGLAWREGEVASLEYFAGVVVILRARAAGTTLPYPADPTYGFGKPNP